MRPGSPHLQERQACSSTRNVSVVPAVERLTVVSRLCGTNEPQQWGRTMRRFGNGRSHKFESQGMVSRYRSALQSRCESEMKAFQRYLRRNGRPEWTNRISRRTNLSEQKLEGESGCFHTKYTCLFLSTKTVLGGRTCLSPSGFTSLHYTSMQFCKVTHGLCSQLAQFPLQPFKLFYIGRSKLQSCGVRGPGVGHFFRDVLRGTSLLRFTSLAQLIREGRESSYLQHHSLAMPPP